MVVVAHCLWFQCIILRWPRIFPNLNIIESYNKFIFSKILKSFLHTNLGAEEEIKFLRKSNYGMRFHRLNDHPDSVISFNFSICNTLWIWERYYGHVPRLKLGPLTANTLLSSNDAKGRVRKYWGLVFCNGIIRWVTFTSMFSSKCSSQITFSATEWHESQFLNITNKSEPIICVICRKSGKLRLAPVNQPAGVVSSWNYSGWGEDYLQNVQLGISYRIIKHDLNITLTFRVQKHCQLKTKSFSFSLHIQKKTNKSPDLSRIRLGEKV